MEEFTVKARGRQGTSSLDLTIPTKIVKEYNVSPGDVFKVKVIKEKELIKLEFIAVYMHHPIKE
jgi:antitoxin component of MazEF toxin-antitoxin module